MKYADPKVIWLAGATSAIATELAVQFQRHCRSRSIPAMVIDESQIGSCGGGDCATGGGRLCRLAKALAEQGYPVIVAASYRTTKCLAWNRAHLPGYFEVHLKGAGDVHSDMVPVAPDVRVSGAADMPISVSESIFEEVFGRGQLMPGVGEHAVLPGAGFLPSLQAI